MIAVWVAVAAATAAVGVAALDIAGAGILGPAGQTLSQEDVARQLAAAPPATTPTPSPTASTAPPTSSTPAPTPRALPLPQGTLYAQCDNGQVTLMSWSLASGYREDGVNKGPGASASIKIKTAGSSKGGRGSEVTAIVTCVAGDPHVETAADDH
jgi:hypothetical protein